MTISEKALKNKSFFPLYFLIFLALVLFPALFFLERAGKIDFWWGMCFNLVILVSLGFAFEPAGLRLLKQDLTTHTLSKTFGGILALLFLYGVFWAGRGVVSSIFSFAPDEIAAVYAFKGGASDWRVALSMLLIIGPGEEIFWRGTLQRLLGRRFNPRWGFVLTLLFYTLIHAPSLNFTLVATAFICGLFWGALYWWKRSVLLLVVSHTFWDLLIFLILPLNF